jgi:cell filamentation protein
MSDETYCYPPDYTVLRNRFGIRDADELDELEREFVTTRMRQRLPLGDFDLSHLRAIHRHLFQDVVDWAGELRTVEISKGGNQFQFRRFIETGMADVRRRLAAQDFLRGLPASDFAERAGAILGDVNYCHPFREGNGRTQLVYLRQLATRAGHGLQLERLDRDAWMAASREAHLGRYEAMGWCIASAIQPDRERDRRQRDR